MKGSTQIRVVVPADLVRAVDTLVARRARSRFLAEAVEEKPVMERSAKIPRKAAGSLAGEATPEWEDRAAWVRRTRESDDKGLERLWDEREAG